METTMKIFCIVLLSTLMVSIVLIVVISFCQMLKYLKKGFKMNKINENDEIEFNPIKYSEFFKKE